MRGSGTVTLGEGNTPLLNSVAIGPAHGAPRLAFKLESCNPSGSYKDRFVAAEVGRMVANGGRACVATSSGNTGSALAAGCARYGIRCSIFVNDGAPSGKLMQMQAHGARVLRVPGFATDPAITRDVFATLAGFCAETGIPLVISAFRYCPEGMRGVQGIAREIAAAAGAAPDHLFVPVGGGGLYCAVVQGFQEFGSPLPRVHAVQPSGCLTVVASYLRGDREIRPVASTTRVSGLSVPSDIDGSLALHRLRECNGAGIAVTDDEVFAAQRMLLEQEGVYSEPAGATALAGWISARRAGLVADHETAVCLVTGHGFKDPLSMEEAATRHPARTIDPASLATVLANIGTEVACSRVE